MLFLHSFIHLFMQACTYTDTYAAVSTHTMGGRSLLPSRGFWGGTQVIKLHSQHLYLLSHPKAPKADFCYLWNYNFLRGGE